MHKVVVERPRGGQGWARQFPRPTKPFDELPKYEGIRRPHAQRKWFTDLLGPLKRWLRSQVGRPWNDVYSEACQVIKPDSVVRAHIKTHLLAFVEQQTFLRDGRVWCFVPWGYGGDREIPVERAFARWTQFYLHPETRLLCSIPRTPRRRQPDRDAEHRARTQRWQSGSLLLRKLNGLWFACEVEPFPRRPQRGDSPWRFDLAEGRAIHLKRAQEIYGVEVFCVAKRQLSRKELRRHGLANSSPAAPAAQSMDVALAGAVTSPVHGPATRPSGQPACPRVESTATPTQEAVWQTTIHNSINPFFEITSKRRKGFPSETQVRKGLRIVHGDKELCEKLGRNDLCPCGSSRRFQELLPPLRPIRWPPPQSLRTRVSMID